MRSLNLLNGQLLALVAASIGPHDTNKMPGRALAHSTTLRLNLNLAELGGKLSFPAGVELAANGSLLVDANQGATVVLHVPVEVRVASIMMGYGFDKPPTDGTAGAPPPAVHADRVGRRNAEDAGGIAKPLKMLHLKPANVYPFAGVIVFILYSRRIMRRYATTTPGEKAPNVGLEVLAITAHFLCALLQSFLSELWRTVEQQGSANVPLRVFLGMTSFVVPTILVSMFDNFFLIYEENDDESGDIE